MRRRLALALLALLATSLEACKSDPPHLWILVANRTGNHMADFVLDYGSGTIAYPTFGRDFTYSKRVVIERDHPLTVRYTEVTGETVEREIDWRVEPKHNGGRLSIEFLPQRSIKVRYSIFQD